MNEPLVFLKAGTSVCGPYDEPCGAIPSNEWSGENVKSRLFIGEHSSILG